MIYELILLILLSLQLGFILFNARVPNPGLRPCTGPQPVGNQDMQVVDESPFMQVSDVHAKLSPSPQKGWGTTALIY